MQLLNKVKGVQLLAKRIFATGKNDGDKQGIPGGLDDSLKEDDEEGKGSKKRLTDMSKNKLAKKFRQASTTQVDLAIMHLMKMLMVMSMITSEEMETPFTRRGG